MQLLTLLACAATFAGATTANAAPPPTPAPPTQDVPFRPVPALLGAWRDPQGHLLPPGVAPFEAIHSALTLAPDGGFTLTVDKAAGPLRQSGTYTAKGDRLTLSFLAGSAVYRFSRTGDRLDLRPLSAGVDIALVTAEPTAANGGPVLPAVAAGQGPHVQLPNPALHRRTGGTSGRHERKWIPG